MVVPRVTHAYYITKVLAKIIVRYNGTKHSVENLSFILKFVEMARKKTSLELYAMRIVKDKREAAGISQRQLSMDMNLDMGAVGKVEDENDPAKYNINHLNALARYFSCYLWDFFPDEPFADKNTRYIVKKK